MTPGIEGGPFVGLAFNWGTTPWRTDADCAREIVAALGCVVRCTPGPDYPSASGYSTTWLEVDPNGERIVVWETFLDELEIPMSWHVVHRAEEGEVREDLLQLHNARQD